MLFQSARAKCDMRLIENSNATPGMSQQSLIKRAAVALVLTLSLSAFPTSESFAAEHIIQLTAEETQDDGFGNKLLAYKMLSHRVDGLDITSRYSSEATIPGPTNPPASVISKQPAAISHGASPISQKPS